MAVLILANRGRNGFSSLANVIFGDTFNYNMGDQYMSYCFEPNKNQICNNCGGLFVYLNTGRCDDCQGLKIRMAKDVKLAEKLLKEIKNDKRR